MECHAIRDDLLDVLYGEAGEAARLRVEEHLAGCQGCRDELAGLQRVRGRLVQWTLPHAGRARTPARGVRALAAAAVLLLALAGALRIARAEFRFDAGPVRFAVGAAPHEMLVALEQRQRAEIAELRAELRALRGERGDEELLRRVRELLQASEARQAQALQANLGELAERAEAQRRYDLARIGAGLSYLEGKTGQHVARTTELMNYVLTAAERR